MVNTKSARKPQNTGDSYNLAPPLNVAAYDALSPDKDEVPGSNLGRPTRQTHRHEEGLAVESSMFTDPPICISGANGCRPPAAAGSRFALGQPAGGG